MFSLTRSSTRTILFLFVLASLVLIGCGTRGTNDNWPGLSTDGENVYVAYGQRVIGYNVADQRQLWIFPAEASAAPIYAAPSVNEDGRIVIGDYGVSGGMLSPKPVTTVYALQSGNSSTPDELWTGRELVAGKIVAPPLQIGDTVYIGADTNELVALNAESGTERWRFGTDHAIWGQPAYRDGILYVADLDKSIHAIEAETGDELWRNDLNGALIGGPILNDKMYLSSFGETVYALDINTGDELWTAVADDSVWGAPAYANGVVYFTDLGGGVYAVDAQDGKQLWRQTLRYPLHTSPVAFNGAVYIAAGPEGDSREGILIAYNADDGSELWQKITTSSLTSTPVVVDNSIIVVAQGASAYSLIAFNAETGTQQWTYNLPE